MLNESESEDSNLNSAKALPAQKNCDLKLYPSVAQEKEKFYQLLSFLKNKNSDQTVVGFSDSRNSSFDDIERALSNVDAFNPTTSAMNRSFIDSSYCYQPSISPINLSRNPSGLTTQNQTSFFHKRNSTKCSMISNKKYKMDSPVKKPFTKKFTHLDVYKNNSQDRLSSYKSKNLSRSQISCGTTTLRSNPRSNFMPYVHNGSIDDAIDDLTKSPEKQKEEKDSDLVNLFQNSPEKVHEKLKNKLEIMQTLGSRNKAINLSTNQASFLRGCIRCLEKATKTKEVDEKEFLEEFKLTISGDIFKGEDDGNLPNGYGVLLTNKNELIEGIFKAGVIQSGRVRILYANGEYYTGLAKQDGVRNGEGIHYYANGDIYEGEFVDNLRVGKSWLKFADGSEYIGQFIDDTADGTGIFSDKEGNRYMTIVEEDHKKTKIENLHQDQETMNGYFLKGKIYGKGEIKYKNGNTYLGVLKGTKRHGKGVMNYVVALRGGDHNDVGDFTGSWVRDKRNGPGTMKYLNGDKFEGVWKDDKWHKGELVTMKGDIYVGTFMNNLYHGRGKLTLNNGTVVYGEFVNGIVKNPAKLELKDGRTFEGQTTEFDIGRQGKLTYTNGDVYEGLFEEKLRCGVGVFTTSDGSKYEGRWIDDKKDGYGKEYNAVLDEYYEGKFSNNKRDGEGKLINRKGEVYVGEFRNGKKASMLQATQVLSKEERLKVIKNFMKPKPNYQPNVRILE